MIRIIPQVWKTHSGERPITYAIYYQNRFCGYARCFCKAMQAAKLIEMSI